MKTVQNIVDTLLDYKWDYKDTGHESTSPVIVLGPNVEDGDYNSLDNRSTKLRAVCCGGNLFDIPYDDVQDSYVLLNKEYYKYAVGLSSDGMSADQNGKTNEIPESMVIAYPDDFALMKHKTIKENTADVQKMLSDVSFSEESGNYTKALDFAILGTTNKNKKANPKNGVRGERWIEEIILKKYIDKAYTENALLIFDEETEFNHINKRKRTKATGEYFLESELSDTCHEYSKSCRPDIVAFDGEHFGLIELKYNAKSMVINSDNSLRDHYLDFQLMIDTMKDIVIKEYIRKLWFLFDFGIADSSWKSCFEKYGLYDDNFWKKDYESMIAELKNMDVSNIQIWSALLFVNDGTENALVARKRSVKKNIKDQLDNILPDKSVDVRYQIFEGEAKDYVPDFSDLNKFMQTL